MKKEKKFFIMGNPGNNIGDVAAMEGIVFGLKKFFKNCKIYVSYSGNPNTEDIDDYVEQYFHDENFFSKKSIIRLYFMTLFNQENNILTCIKDSDVIIFAPGACGLHKNNYEHWVKIMIMLKIVKKMNKIVMFHACSMGPFDKHINKIKKIISEVDIFTVRDETSIRYLNDIGISNVTFTGDSAMMVPSKLYFKDKKKILGITPIDFTKFAFESIKDKNNVIIQSFVDAINYMYHSKIIDEVYFISHIFNNHSEEYIVDVIIKRIDPNIKYKLIKHTSVIEAFKIYSKLYCCISARHHGGAFSLKNGVPSICIAYEHKAHGFFKQFDLDEYVIDAESLDSTILITKINELVKNYDYILKQIEKNIEIVEKRTFKNELILKEYICSINED